MKDPGCKKNRHLWDLTAPASQGRKGACGRCRQSMGFGRFVDAAFPPARTASAGPFGRPHPSGRAPERAAVVLAVGRARALAAEGRNATSSKVWIALALSTPSRVRFAGLRRASPTPNRVLTAGNTGARYRRGPRLAAVASGLCRTKRHRPHSGFAGSREHELLPVLMADIAALGSRC